MVGNRLAGVLFISLVCVACGGGGGSSSSLCVGDICADGMVRPRDAAYTDADSRAVPSDLPGDGFELPDFTLPEVTPSDGGPDGPVEGGFGWPCEGPADCDFGLCITTVMGSLCTVACIEECPDADWQCELLSGLGPDAMFVCIPPETALCRPCAVDGDCALVPEENAHCVAYGDVGSFCAIECDPAAGSPCADGYECEQVASFPA